MTRKSPTRYFQNSPRREPCRALPILRGLSSLATLSRRKSRMRLVCCGSSLLSSRSAPADTSIFRAMTLHHVFQRNRALFTAANTFEGALGQIHVFEVLEVLQDG